ncbi:MAG: hypothetical protein JWN70_6235 [Planctomycetaceae bacterium]|nr:hypothetical protein [Planctomycetaceae bacterium]
MMGFAAAMTAARSQTVARNARLNHIAYQHHISLRWTENIPFRRTYLRYFNQLPSLVHDSVLDIYDIHVPEGDAVLPPTFFHDLNHFNHIEKLYWNIPRHSAEVAKLVAHQQNLRELSLVTKNLQDSDLDCVSQFSNLNTLAIDGLESKHLRGQFLQAAVGNSPQLKRLIVHHVNLSDEASQNIGKLTTLTNLDLTGSELTSKSASCLSGIPLLDDLTLNEIPIDDAFGATLTKLTELKFLRVKGTLLTSAALQNLEHCPSLILLETGGKQGDSELLSHVSKCPKLKVIDIVWTGKFSSGDIANFNQFPGASYLYFADIGDTEAEHLVQCEHLTGLDIHSTRLTLLGVRSLMGMTDLRHLKLAGTAWGPELVDVLEESGTLETVKILDRLWEWWEFEDLREKLRSQSK